MSQCGIECHGVNPVPHAFPQQQGGRGLRFTSATHDLAGGIAVRVPQRAMMSAPRARRLCPPPLVDAAGIVATTAGEDISDADVLSAFVFAASYKAGCLPSQLEAIAPGGHVVAADIAEDSLAKHAAWMRMQPSEADLQGLPVLWSEGDLIALGPRSRLAAGSRRTREEWTKQFAAIQKALPSCGLDAAADGGPVSKPHAVEERDWFWARCCVRSRVFVNGFSDVEDEDHTAAAEGATEDSGTDDFGCMEQLFAGEMRLNLVLVPLIDMLNHAQQPLPGMERTAAVGTRPAGATEGSGSAPVPNETVWTALGEDDSPAHGGASAGDTTGCASDPEYWLEVRCVEPSEEGEQCCIGYGDHDLEAMLGTYGFVPGPAATDGRGRVAVPESLPQAVQQLLGLEALLHGTGVEIQLPALDTFDRWAGHDIEATAEDASPHSSHDGLEPGAAAPEAEVAEGGPSLLELRQHALAEALGIELPLSSPEPAAGPGVSRAKALPIEPFNDTAVVSLPQLRGEWPARALLVLRMCVAATADDLEVLMQQATTGEVVTGGEVSLRTKHRAYEAMGRLVQAWRGSRPDEGSVRECIQQLQHARAASLPRLESAARVNLAAAHCCHCASELARAGLEWGSCGAGAAQGEALRRLAGALGTNREMMDAIQEGLND